jgi:hypothetical protein
MKYSQRLRDIFVEMFEVPGRIGSTVSLRELRTILSRVCKEFKIHLVIGTQFKPEKIYKKYRFITRGFYYPVKQKNKKYNIVVRVDFLPETKVIMLTKKFVNKLIFNVSSVIQHEIIHRQQFSSPNSGKYEQYIPYIELKKLSRKKRAECRYLSEYCEIDAHSHDIALEMRRHYPTLRPEDIIENIDEYRKLDTYFLYKRAFRNTEWSEIRTILLNLAGQWYKDSIPTCLKASIYTS